MRNCQAQAGSSHPGHFLYSSSFMDLARNSTATRKWNHKHAYTYIHIKIELENKHQNIECASQIWRLVWRPTHCRQLRNNNKYVTKMCNVELSQNGGNGTRTPPGLALYIISEDPANLVSRHLRLLTIRCQNLCTQIILSSTMQWNATSKYNIATPPNNPIWDPPFGTPTITKHAR